MTWIGEAGVALVLGCLVGAAVLSPLVATHGAFASHLGFSKPLFFLAILPPIIFEAGWRLVQGGRPCEPGVEVGAQCPSRPLPPSAAPCP